MPDTFDTQSPSLSEQARQRAITFIGEAKFESLKGDPEALRKAIAEAISDGFDRAYLSEKENGGLASYTRPIGNGKDPFDNMKFDIDPEELTKTIS